MYTVYVEQQYPTSTLNKYLDYLLYQEQLKKEQEALYYYRLRQQQQKAYLQEVQRRRQQEQERKLILAILEQQQLHQQKLRQQRLLQEQLRQQQILQQEKLRQQRLLQEKLRQQRLYQLEQQKRASNCSFVCQDDEEDNDRLAQLVEFLFGPEEATPRQQEPEKNVLTLDEFLDYIAKKASELDHDEQGPSSSKPVTEKEEPKNVVVTIPITEPAATEEVSKSADATASEEVSHDSVVSEELPVHEPVVSESQGDLSTSEPVVSESQEVPVSEPVVSKSQEELSTSEPAVSKPQEETVADEKQQEPQENDESIPEADPIVASVQSLTDGVSAIHVDNQLLTTDEFVDYIANKSRELFEEKPANEEKQEKLKLLQGIQEELEDIRKDNEQHILNTQLDFSQSDDDSVSATTAENREFLGYEDQIMKVLLKLDTVESDGDDEIRTERKNLVKLAEKMLDRLDEFKQKEWERASISSHSEVEEDDYLYV